VGFGLGTTLKYLRGAAGIGLASRSSTCDAQRAAPRGNGLCTTIKYLRGASGIGLGTTNKNLRCTTSSAAGNGLGTTAKYLVNQNAGAGNNWAKAHYTKAGRELCLIPLYCSGFCSKLRAPHRDTSLGSCVLGARAFSLCSSQLLLILLIYKPSKL